MIKKQRRTKKNKTTKQKQQQQHITAPVYITSGDDIKQLL